MTANGITTVDNGNEEKVESKLIFYRLFHQYIWIFPLGTTILTPLICLVPYICAVYYEHLEPVLPLVSDAGTFVPQAAYFSQMLDISAFCLTVSTYARNKQIKFYLDDQKASKSLEPDQEHRVRKWNFVAGIFGYITALGMIMIGNFRVNECWIGHFLGANLLFNGVMVYMIMMVVITQRMYKCDMETKPTSMRLITGLAFFTLLGCTLFSIVALFMVGLTKFSDANFRRYWKLTDQAGIWHVLGTANQWIAILTASGFYACFTRRFYLFSKTYF